MCVCVCVFVILPFILDVWLVDVPAGVTQEVHYLLPSLRFINKSVVVGLSSGMERKV